MFRFSLANRIKLVLALVPVCFLGVTITTTVQARQNYALIIANSDYPNLPEKNWLKGPKNDEALVRDYLLHSAPVKFAPENVVALGSGDGMQLGTHQAILDSLGKLAGEAKAGDFVYLHFSGHGSQQPATDDRAEPDGRDEVFLSADTKLAPEDNPRFMPNALTDNEVGAALKAIRKTGASVWVVFDSCFSGSMTRGAPGDPLAADRDIDPGDLGIPASAFNQPVTAPDENERAVPMASMRTDDEDDANEGPLVAFFAAQSTETTNERGFGVPQPNGTTTQVPYGVFTYTIFSALAKNPGMTYRQLAQSVLASYAGTNVLRPTPLFEGKLDATVFASTEVADAEQWPTLVGLNDALTISAGQLHGLAAGTKLLLLPNPAASNDQAIGLMQVASATQLRSTLVPASDDKHTLIEASAVPTGAYVRLVDVSFPFELKVARPDPASTDATQVKAVNAALDAILANKAAQLKLRVVEPGEQADVRLAVLSDNQVAKLARGAVTAQSLDVTPKLWLLPSTGEASIEPQRHAPTMALPETAASASDPFAKGLENNLVTIFRAIGLSQLSQANTFRPKDFSLSFGLQQAGANKIEAMASENTPVIRPGDRVYVDFSNVSGKAADINVLYIDHDYGITLLCQSHLANGDRLFQPLADIVDTDQGSESIVTVINESGRDLTDLSFLTQPGLPVATRGVDQGGLMGMLADLGSGVPTRAVPVMQTDTKTPRGAVEIMPVEALASTGAAPASGNRPTDERQSEGSCASN